MTKPNFIIVGAAKCGTTSLHSYLQKHPDIFMSDPKEPSFFCRPWPQEVGLPQTEEEYFALFSEGEGKIGIGEASANYLFVPEAPESIHKLLGDDIKLVIMLRNPIDMMYSLWQHACRGKWEDRPVKEALLTSRFDEPLAADTRKSLWTTLYARRANYIEQLERYYTLFPRENIKVIIFEEFYSEDFPLYTDLLDFLGVKESSTPDGTILNKGIGLYSRRLNHFFHKQYPCYIYPAIKYIVPHFVRKKVKEMIFSVALSKGKKQNESVRAALQETLYDSVRNLEVLLERDLSKVWF